MKNSCLLLCLLIIGVGLGLNPAFAEDNLQLLSPEDGPDPRPFSPPRHYVCLRADNPIAIDGLLDEADWHNCLWSEVFTDIRAPYGAAQPSPATKFKMLWDDEYLYVAVWLSETHIQAKLMKRETLDATDFDLEIYLDANADSQQYSLIKINPYNVPQSVFYNKPPKDGGIGRLWPIQGFQHAVFAKGTLNDPNDKDQYWQIELAIPLAMPAILGGVTPIPSNGETWRVNFARTERRGKLVLSSDKGSIKPEQLAATEKLIRCCWTPQGVINMHRPEAWGYLQFSSLPAGSPADFTPDPTEWARYTLHRILYAQKWHALNFGGYANSLDLLGLDSTPPMFATEPVRITASDDRFTASVQLRLPEMSIRTLSIDQDAKITLTGK